MSERYIGGIPSSGAAIMVCMEYKLQACFELAEMRCLIEEDEAKQIQGII